MNESQLLTRFLQSGETVAVGGEIRDDIVIEKLENHARSTTETLLDHFFNDLDRPPEILQPDIVIPIFMLGKLLQMIPLRETHPLRDLQVTVSELLANNDLEQAQNELLAVETPPTNSELVLSILQTIRTLLDRV